ncbi:NepR family anti-sigma factor [Roseibium sp.]|uniref:NepR family anti-sigma factor n=1 Tax=Roseibium sp. TaxID=1936156 RepID=UPI003A9714FE
MAQSRKTAQSPLSDGLIAPGKLGRTKEDWIGNQLKKIYDEAVTEDIPDDMLALLSQLDGSPDDESGEECAR